MKKEEVYNYIKEISPTIGPKNYTLVQLKFYCNEYCMKGNKDTASEQILNDLTKAIICEVVGLVKTIKIFYTDLILNGVERSEAIVRSNKKISNIKKVVDDVDPCILKYTVEKFFNV